MIELELLPSEFPILIFRVSITQVADETGVRLTGRGADCLFPDGRIEIDLTTLRGDSPTAYDRVDDRVFDEGDVLYQRLRWRRRQ
jgi:hypothetical protein